MCDVTTGDLVVIDEVDREGVLIDHALSVDAEDQP